MEKSDVHAFFALLGLGVSVKLTHCYHYFMAASVSHCTPTPISTVNDVVVTYTAGDINIVGWGGGNASRERRRFYNDNGGPEVPRLSRAMFYRWFATLPANIAILGDNNNF